MTRVSEPIPVEDATSLVIPGEWNPTARTYLPGGTWKWADPILSGASDSIEWRQLPAWDPQHGHSENRITRSVITNLYRCGYALVKILPEDGE